MQSHPVWVRGLKRMRGIVIRVTQVAPCMGAWIETTHRHTRPHSSTRRTLYGCVD